MYNNMSDFIMRHSLDLYFIRSSSFALTIFGNYISPGTLFTVFVPQENKAERMGRSNTPKRQAKRKLQISILTNTISIHSFVIFLCAKFVIVSSLSVALVILYSMDFLTAML